MRGLLFLVVVSMAGCGTMPHRWELEVGTVEPVQTPFKDEEVVEVPLGALKNALVVGEAYELLVTQYNTQAAGIEALEGAHNAEVLGAYCLASGVAVVAFGFGYLAGR